jgi:hypothetical protein
MRGSRVRVLPLDIEPPPDAPGVVGGPQVRRVAHPAVVDRAFVGDDLVATSERGLAHELEHGIVVDESAEREPVLCLGGVHEPLRCLSSDIGCCHGGPFLPEMSSEVMIDSFDRVRIGLQTDVRESA